MYSFYSLTSLRVNVSFSVSSCRRRGNLQGYFHWTHRLPGGSYPARAVTPRLGLQSRGHHQRAERPRCRGGGYVGLGRHGIRPAGRDRHGDAVTGSPKMMCWRQVASMNSSGIWRPDWCKVFEKRDPPSTPTPRLRYSPPLTANDNHTKTRRSASVNPPVPAGSLFREASSLCL